jgi:Predicted membrane protein
VIKVSKKIKALVLTIMSIVILSFALMIPGVIAAADATTTDTTTTDTAIVQPKLDINVVYPKLSAKAGTNFEFKFDLVYQGTEDTTFDIVTEAPSKDWYVVVSPTYDATQISAVKLTPGKTESLKLVVTPPVNKDLQKAGDFKVKVKVSNAELKLNSEFEFLATVTATYSMDFTAKYGVLNTKATSGKNNPFTFVLTNSGSGDISNITLKSDAPQKWIVKFDPEKIDTLKGAETKDINVTITPPDKTIAGDYMLNFSVNSTDASGNADLRVTVETPSIWGWVGIGIIVIVVLGVAIIFARLGRR